MTVSVTSSRSSAQVERSLYGRQNARDAFLEVFDGVVTTNTPTTVFLVGEGGMGKTRFLLEVEAALRLQNPNVTVSYGRALAQHSESNGFQPIREALSDLVYEAQRDNRERLVRRISRSLFETAPDWLAAIPAVGNVLSAATKTATNINQVQHEKKLDDSLTRQFCRFVQDIIDDGPFVLCLDDLHWSDASTVDLIYSLTQLVGPGQFLLVCSYREDALNLSRDTPHPLLETLSRIERYAPFSRIELSHLGREHVTQLISEVLGRTPLPALVECMIDITAGNPLFLHEYVGLLIDQLGRDAPGSAYLDHLTSTAERQPPRRVEAVIKERLLRLTDDEIRILEVAALLGPAFSPSELLAVLDISVKEARAGLRSLCRRHALIHAVTSSRHDPQYAFHHPIVAQVLDSRLREDDLFDYRDLHRAIAEHLDARVPRDLNTLERLAYHTAASGDKQAALNAALEAGTHAWSMGAASECLRLLKKVTQERRDDHEDSNELLRAVGLRLRAHNAVADHEGAVAFGSLFANGSFFDRLPADARLAYARALRMTNNWTEARAQLAPMARDSSTFSRDVQAEALLLSAQIALCGAPPSASEALTVLTQARTLTDDPQIVYQILGHVGLSHLALGEISEAFSALNEAAAEANLTRHPLDRYEAVHWLSKAQIACLRLDDALASINEIDRIAASSGVAGTVPFHFRDRSRVLALQGTVREAARLYASYLESVSLLISPLQFDRALATLACQLLEFRQRELLQRAAEFAVELERCLSATCLTETQVSHVQAILQMSPDIRSVDDARTKICRDGLATEDEFDAAETIFRFDVPDLESLRYRLIEGA